MSKYIDYFIRDVITHPCPNFSGGLIKPPLKLGHGWIIICRAFVWILPAYFGWISNIATTKRFQPTEYDWIKRDSTTEHNWFYLCRNIETTLVTIRFSHWCTKHSAKAYAIKSGKYNILNVDVRIRKSRYYVNGISTYKVHSIKMLFKKEIGEKMIASFLY